LGVISPALFTMMVLMALVTTFMTTPVLEWIYPARMIQEASAMDEAEGREYTVLLPISLPGSGPGLLDAAVALIPAGRNPRIYALHLERTSEQSLTRVDRDRLPGQNEVLQPLLAHAEARGVEVRPLAFASHDVSRDILDVARVKHADLVLMGWHKPILGRSILGGTVSDVLGATSTDVAILVERGPVPWRRILVPFRDARSDGGALDAARKIAVGTGAKVTILHVVTPDGVPHAERRTRWETLSFREGIHLKLVTDTPALEAAVREAGEGYDLIVVGASRAWDTLPTPFAHRHEALARASAASLLVVRPANRGAAVTDPPVVAADPPSMAGV
jgi:nucleotide-binding universal stress UspA family protein